MQETVVYHNTNILSNEIITTILLPPLALSYKPQFCHKVSISIYLAMIRSK